jgi:cytochrome P450
MSQTASPFTATVDGERIRILSEIARQGPVVKVALPTGMPVWLVTRYDAARSVMNNPALIKAPSPMSRVVYELRPTKHAAFTSHLLSSDGEVHARRRRLVAAAFTKRAADRLEPRIFELAQGFLDELGTAGPDEVVDLYERYAYPLPMAVICELLGIPEGQRARFHELILAFFVQGMFLPLEDLATATDELFALVEGVIAEKRAAPDEALISALVAARDGSDRLTEDELSSMVMLLVVAGHETTVNLISNGMAALFAHPDQLARLRAEPARWPGAVEELLRFATPVQSTFPLLAQTDVEIAGVTVPAGELIMPALLPANRDPAHIDNPDTLDVTRPPQQHLAFGHGPHHCLGISLARLEARIGFSALVERFPDLALAIDPAELRWQPNWLFHSLTGLPVRLGKPA